MIFTFKVKNFLSFKEEQILSFEATSDKTLEEYFVHKLANGERILKLGIIYGANASGKTNLLKALGFLRKVVVNPRKKDEKTGFIPFLFDEEWAKQPGEFELVFYIEEVKYMYCLKVDEDYVHEEELQFYPKGQPVEIFYRNTKKQEFKFGTHKQVSILKKYRNALETNTVDSMTMISALQVTNVEFPELKKVFNWFHSFCLPLETPNFIQLEHQIIRKINKNNQLSKFILSFLNEADNNIADLRIDTQIVNMKRIFPDNDSGEGYKVIKRVINRLYLSHLIENDIPKELEFNLESNGTRRSLFLSSLLYELIYQNHFLSIDEIESSLHPDLVHYFINVFLANSAHSQMLLTTHNLDILSDADEIRRDVIWFTEKQRNGGTDLYSLSDFKTDKIRKSKGISYLKAYKIGKFGALPNVGSIFLKDEIDGTKK